MSYGLTYDYLQSFSMMCKGVFNVRLEFSNCLQFGLPNFIKPIELLSYPLGIPSLQSQLQNKFSNVVIVMAICGAQYAPCIFSCADPKNKFKAITTINDFKNMHKSRLHLTNSEFEKDKFTILPSNFYNNVSEGVNGTTNQGYHSGVRGIDIDIVQRTSIGYISNEINPQDYFLHY